MTTNDSNKKMEENLGTVKIEPGEKVENVTQKVINDDYQVILDNRGFYKVGKKWWIKVRRIKVKEMISAWGIISSVFGNVATMKLDFDKADTWVLLFTSAIPVVPGKFYQFLAQVMELQYDESLPQEELKILRNEYNDYLRKDLEVEELIDVVVTIFNQEKDRFGELVKKVKKMFKPLIKLMMRKE